MEKSRQIKSDLRWSLRNVKLIILRVVCRCNYILYLFFLNLVLDFGHTVSLRPYYGPTSVMVL